MRHSIVEYFLQKPTQTYRGNKPVLVPLLTSVAGELVILMEMDGPDS